MHRIDKCAARAAVRLGSRLAGRLGVALCGAALAALAARGVAAQSTRDVQGVVRDSSSGESLPHATISLAELHRIAETNADGRFALLRVPAGTYTLRVTYLGYRPQNIRVRTDSLRGALVVALSRTAVELQTVKVEGNPQQSVSVGEHVGELSVTPQMVATMPSVGEKDIFRALQLLPGVSASNDASSGLYVRGGTPDENLVLLDGMTVYHADHFFGLFSAFNADAIKDIRMYAGGFPARYGGRVSSVVDLTGKTGDERQFRASGGLNLLSGRAEVEVPLGRGSWLISGRRSYTDVVRTPLYSKLFGLQTAGTSSAPQQRTGALGGFAGFGGPGSFQSVTVAPSFYFYDLNSKLTYRPSDKDVASISYYSGQDNLDQSTGAQSVQFPGIGGGGPTGGGLAAGTLSTTDLTAWGNRGVSGRWFRQWGSRLSSDVLVSTSRYTSSGDRSSSATTTTNSGFNIPRPAFSEVNTVRDATLRLDNALQIASPFKLEFGTWLTRSHVGYSYRQSVADTSARALSQDATGRLAAAYAEASWSPLPRLELTGGVRMASYDLTSRTYSEPRTSLTYRVTSAVQLKGAWGRYHQFVSHVENEDVLNGSHDFWLLAGADRVKPLGAEHRIVGISFERPTYLFDVEAYDKRLSDVSLFSTRYRSTSLVQQSTTLVHTGDGRARGIDALAQRKFGAFTGWVSYTLSEARYAFPDIDGGQQFAASQDQRHQAKTVGMYALGRWTFSSTWVYASGKPYTAPEGQYYLTLLDGSQESYIHVSEKNAVRLPAYHRLDLAATRQFDAGSHYVIDVGASVFNAYNRQNVWYRSFDLSTAPLTVTDVHMLGMTPSIDIKISRR